MCQLHVHAARVTEAALPQHQQPAHTHQLQGPFARCANLDSSRIRSLKYICLQLVYFASLEPHIMLKCMLGQTDSVGASRTKWTHTVHH